MEVHRSEMFNLVIVGAGGFAREVRHIFGEQLNAGEFRWKGFLGRDHGAAVDPSIEPYLLGDPACYEPQVDDRLVLAIGNMPARRRLVDSLRAKGGTFLTLVHPMAFIASSARLADGVLIYPFAVVSHEAVLDDCVKLNYFASVGHNARLGSCCLLAPYATVNGFSVLEEDVYMSTHSTVGPQVRVGARTTISANSATTKDVAAESFVFGVPGRVTPRLGIG